MLPLPLYRLIDQAMVTLTPGLRFYEDGFGDRRKLEDLVARIRGMDVPAGRAGLDLQWDDAPRPLGPGVVRLGRFTSPKRLLDVVEFAERLEPAVNASPYIQDAISRCLELPEALQVVSLYQGIGALAKDLE